MSDSIRRGVVAILVNLLLLPPLVLSQEPPSEDDLRAVFSEVLDVRVVNVEVVVTDKEGNRVRGLRPSDFRLLVDGEEQSIDYFSEVVGGAIQPLEASTGEAEKPLPAIESAGRVPMSYLVFIDDQFSLARDRNRVLKKLREDLDLGEDDRIAMVAFDGRRLELITNWTNSDRVLDDAFEEALRRDTMGLMRISELNTNDTERRERSQLTLTTQFFAQTADEAAQYELESMLGRIDPVELAYIRQLEDQLKRSVSATVATMRSFANPPGRKVLLLLSGGWPYSPAEYALSYANVEAEELSGAGADPLLARGREIYNPLTDTANLLGYTLYPVDVPGLNRRSIDSEFGSPSVVTGEPLQTAGGLFNRELQVHDSLQYMAAETGGQASLNGQRDIAFARVVEDTRTYYWLGFQPDRKQDDKEHKIEVEVLGEKYKVRSRKGFLDLSTETENTMMVESALFFGNPPSEVPLELKIGRPEKAGRGKIHLPIEIGIPMDHVTMIPSAGRYVAEVEYRVTVMDGSGARSDTPLQKILIAGDELPQAGQMYRYETKLTMRKRKHEVIVAVNDPVSGVMMSSALEVDP